MILYAIKNKSTGRHFIHFDGRGTPVWNTSPVFFKQPETIWRNLGRLCSEFYLEPYKVKYCHSYTYYHRNWKNFKAKLLKQYQVVVFKVKVLGSKQIEATKFVIPKKLKKMNMRIK